MWKGKPIGDGSPFEAERAFQTGLASSTLAPSALREMNVPLAERQRCWTSNPARSVRLRHGTLGCGLMVSQLSLKQLNGGSTPPARVFICS